MTNWWQKFEKENIFFVSPDIKRAIGVEDILPNYHIICSYFDPLIPLLRAQGAKIFCLEEEIGKQAIKSSNSGKLIEEKLVLKYIAKHSSAIPRIAYFKPSLKLDFLIKKMGFFSIGNKAELNEKFENKINFYELVSEYFPQHTIPSKIGVLKNLNYYNLAKSLDLPLVVQFGHGWAGKTTFFIKSEEEFINLAQKYAYTRVKVSRNIEGFTILNNCCIYADTIFISSPAIQINAIKELHSNPGVTCGRQWPTKLLTKNQSRIIHDISIKVGKLMARSGFKGFFGLDFIIENKTGGIYLSEANARLTASTPFYTRLERGLNVIPLFAYHLAAFLDISLEIRQGIEDKILGSQITLRLKDHKNLISQMPEAGVYQRENGQVQYLKKEYYPEGLKPDEFIFLSRSFCSKRSNDEELARIETRSEVLDSTVKLKVWVKDLLATKSNEKRIK